MRPYARFTLLLLALLAVPAAAQEPTGGASPDSAATGGAPAGDPSGSRVVVVSDGAYTVSARRNALLGRRSKLRGEVRGAEPGDALTVERFDARTGEWGAVAATTVGEGGRFEVRWRADRIGEVRVRAVLGGSSARAAQTSPELSVTVYRPGMSTWYGPGFYGRRTACGQRMSKRLRGVAHKRLPCGTKVALLYKGRTITVPVVDRGPYRKGTRWDLTAATARALGFEGTGRVGAIRLRGDATAQPSR